MSTGVSATVRELALRLLPRSAELGATLVATITARPASYAGAGRVDADDLLLSCVSNIERMCQTLAGAVPEGHDAFDAPRRTGDRRADQRVPLEEVLASYRQCGRVVWDGLVEELHATPAADPSTLLAAAGEIWSVIDVYSHEVGAAYRAREAELHRRDQRLRDALIVALLEGAYDGPTARAAEALDLVPEGSYLCVVAAQDEVGHDPLPGVRAALREAGTTSAWTQRGRELVGVLAADPGRQPRTRAVLDRLAVGRVGVSAPFEGLLLLPEGHRGALLALRTLPARAGAPAVAWLEERLPEALLAESPGLARRLTARTLGALDDLPEVERQVLLETLTAFLTAQGSVSGAARALFCHRNTVLNRLARLEALTGGSLRDPRHAGMCVLALAALRVHGAS